MLNHIRNLLQKFHHLLTLAIIEVALGIFLLISPSGLAVGLLWVIGLLLLADGVVRCITYFKDPIEEAQKGYKLASGSFLLIAGLFFLFNYKFVVDIFPVLAALYGLVTIVLFFLKLEIMVNRIRQKKVNWYILAASLLFVFIAMIVFYSSAVPFIGAGILLILAGGLDGLCYFGDKGKVAVPTLKELTGNVVSLFKKGEKKAEETAPVQDAPVSAFDPAPVFKPVQESDPFAGMAAETEEGEAEAAEDEKVDPADEDLSWAKHPQIDFPDPSEK